MVLFDYNSIIYDIIWYFKKSEKKKKKFNSTIVNTMVFWDGEKPMGGGSSFYNVMLMRFFSFWERVMITVFFKSSEMWNFSYSSLQSGLFVLKGFNK